MRVATTSLTLALGLSLCGVSGYLLYLLLRTDDDEDDNYTDPFNKASKFKTLEVPVDRHLVKVLIGRGGFNIKQIQEQSNTRINFKEIESIEDQSICVIRGSIEACNIAENLIRDFLDNRPVLECKDLWVNSQCIGRIIGRDGDKINEISSLSGAKITVDNNKTSDQRRITIRGTQDQILVATSLIEEVVEKSRLSRKEIEQTLAKREPRLPLKTTNRSNDSSNDSPKVERISPLPGQPDAQFEVYVSAMVDPSRFWLQIVGPKAAQLDVLVEEMTEYYRQRENRENHVLSSVAKGDLVAAVFQYDGKWYRAEVLGVDEAERLAELYYVDYGDTDCVAMGQLYELRTDFLRLHFQAIECYLARVEPSSADGWSEEAVDRFEEWTHVAQWRKLSARINGCAVRERTRARREGSPVPGVDLFDVGDERDVDVARELVSAGYANYKKDAEGARLLSSSRATSASNVSVASSS